MTQELVPDPIGDKAGLTLVNWNVQFRGIRSEAAGIIRERIFSHQPDVVCLTESFTDFFSGSGHVADAALNYGYPLLAGRRKVLLWSRRPWRNVDQIGHPILPPGRFVAGRTSTLMGDVTVIGVCIPWAHAHVSSGRKDRAPWEDHLAYLVGLDEVLALSRGPTILVGDFNQTAPRSRAPLRAYAALEAALTGRLCLATAGPLQPMDKLAIDHVAHSPDLAAQAVSSISDEAPSGAKLSDHFGVCVQLCRSSG